MASDSRKTHASARTDLVVSSVYRLRDLDHLEEVMQQGTGYLYARDGHPNADALSAKLAELEGTPASIVVSSGMAAVSTILFDQLKPGDVLVAHAELYGKTIRLMEDRLRPLGIEVRIIDVFDTPARRVALQGAKLLWVETVSNPLLRLAPIAQLASEAHSAGALLAVDATFAPGPMVRAFELGADFVMHSLTKILSGHADVTLGAVCGRSDDIDRLKNLASTFGFFASPLDCWLTERGLETLELRLHRVCENASKLAHWLTTQPGVRRVVYPGLRQHPDADLAKSMLQMPGYVLSFELEQGREGVNRLFRELTHIGFFPSLGDTKTTVSYPAGTSHRGLAENARQKLGITDGLIRVSAGLEPFEVLEKDLTKALAKIRT